MSDPEPWALIDSTPVLDASVFRVTRDRARSPRSGRPHTFSRLEAQDWVNVVPITRDGDVVLVRQYRHGSRAMTWEIPGGQVDSGESPADAAARELREETGYGGGTLEFIGVVNPNPALFANACHSYLARDVERQGDIENVGAEETGVAVVSRDELEHLVASGQIDHALVISALFWLNRRRA